MNGYDHPTPDELQDTAERYRTPSVLDIRAGDVSRWIDREPEKTEFAFGTHAPIGSVTVVGGDGGSGKSQLCQQAATAIAASLPFMGLPTIGGAAVLISAEDSDKVPHSRQRRLNDTLGVTMRDLAGRLFIRCLADTDIFLFSDGKPTSLANDLETQLATIAGLRLVVIDSAALVFDDEEISRRRVGAFLRDLNRRAARLSCAIVLITHTSKGSDGSAAKAFSGSTAWVWHARSALLLTAQTNDEPAVLTLIKANYTKAGIKTEMRWSDSGVLELVGAPDETLARMGRRPVERAVLDHVAKAWSRESPLSTAPSVKDRYLPSYMARHGFRAADAEKVMQTFIDTGVLVTDQRRTRSPKGLRIAKAPDWWSEASK